MKNRYFWFSFLGGFLVALLSLFYVVKPFINSGTDVFKPAYKTLAGDPYKIKRSSDKLRLISYWATWCKPCITEFKYFQVLKEKYPEKLEIIAVSDETPDRIQNFINRNPYDFLFLTSVETFSALGLNAIPVNVILDKNGKTVYSRVGGITTEQLEAFLREI